MTTYDYLVDVLENFRQADALLLRDVLLMRHVVTVVVAAAGRSSVNNQAFFTPRLLCHVSIQH